MVALENAEEVLIDDLLDPLSRAIHAADGVDAEYANRTKLQKLLYLAIEEFDLPVTYSWYLAGALVDSETVSTSGLSPEAPIQPDTPALPSVDSATADVSVDEEDDEQDPSADADESTTLDPVLFTDYTPANEADPDDLVADVSRTSDTGLEAHASQSEVIDFYVETLPEVWSQTTMRFLQNFYTEYAPEEYRLLYLTSTNLRAQLTELADAIADLCRGEEPVRSVSELRDSIEFEISDLHYYIQQFESIRGTLPTVVAGTDVLEDALMMIEQKAAEDELRPAHAELVEYLQDFFFYYVWKLPCLIISRETATGPSAAVVKTSRNEELSDFPDRLQEKATTVESALADAGLRPTVGAYDEFNDDEIRSILTDLTGQYYE